jgi:hypothetical protein
MTNAALLANRPVNDSDWRGELLKDDQRWVYGVPPAGNDNYAWVQHFIHHKTIKRFLEGVSPTPGDVDTADFQYLIRSASEQGVLLIDWPTLEGHRDMRAKSSHTYDEKIALQVVAGIPPLLDEVRYLRDRLQPTPGSALTLGATSSYTIA